MNDKISNKGIKLKKWSDAPVVIVLVLFLLLTIAGV